MKRKLLDVLRLIWKIRPLEIILAALTRDRLFGTFITKFPPNHYQYAKGSVRKVTRRGIRYSLDLSDTVDWYIYYGFRETSREQLYKLIKKDNHVIDIGANIGDVSLNAARTAGEQGRVYSFEPDPKNYERLQANLKLNNFPHIHPYQMGLGNKPGKFLLSRVNDGNQGMNRILNKTSDPQKASEIEVSTLDKFVSEYAITKVDLIKIDVEGFEFNVLKGAEQTLKKFHPMLFIELDDNNLREQSSSALELIQMLENLGYNMQHADTKEKINAGVDFKNCHYDIMAQFAQH